ncbi:MAG: hypothetical protein IT215_05265 [Chitinophagaceae bacterium]|nr:hypothetical protein [Chitinophagaceae bacterium]
MKKVLIVLGIIVVIIILIIAIVLFVNAPKLQNVIDDAKIKAEQSALKSFIAGTMAELVAYDMNNKNTIPFEQNPTVKQALQDKLDVIKQKYGGDYSYNVFDTSKDASIKAADVTKGIYFCADSKVVRVVEIKAEDFSKKTDCSGGTLE